MKIERLRAEHYDELLEMLNSTFAHKYGHPVDFESMWPKMWVRDDEHMSRHIAVIEDGRIAAVTGVYPFETYIGDRIFTFATTGNVATLPEYEGRGYFKATFGEAVRSLPPQLRETVVLRYYSEKSVEEISRIMEIPSGTVKSRLHHAREALNQFLTRKRRAL